MRKENENIHLHIIKEDYRRIRMEQTANEAYIGKSEQTTAFQQIPSSAFFELQKLSAITQTPAEGQQVVLNQKVGSCKDVADFKIITLLQNMKREEEELLEQKKSLLAIEQELKNELFKLIEAKKVAINDLKSENSNLEHECKKFAKSLGIPINI
jgi:hypothetical protein